MTGPISGLSTLLSELKRRRVFRVAAVYRAVASASLNCDPPYEEMLRPKG